VRREDIMFFPLTFTLGKCDYTTFWFHLQHSCTNIHTHTHTHCNDSDKSDSTTKTRCQGVCDNPQSNGPRPLVAMVSDL